MRSEASNSEIKKLGMIGSWSSRLPADKAAWYRALPKGMQGIAPVNSARNASGVRWAVEEFPVQL